MEHFLLGIACGLAFELAARLICRYVARKTHIENQKMLRGIK